MNDMKQPQLILVGGSNGSGKTTLARRLIADLGFRYLGADDIAFKINPVDVVSVENQAARQFITDISEAIENKESLIVESTLSGVTLLRHIRQAKLNGYLISIVYIYLESVDISIFRVKLRVSQGGHDVPEEAIRRRFPRSRSNFWTKFRPLADSWELYYNSPEENKDQLIDLVAVAKISKDNLEDIEVSDKFQYGQFLESIGVLYVE